MGFCRIAFQFFRKLLLRTRILKTFAKHYQTGEVLPDEKNSENRRF